MAGTLPQPHVPGEPDHILGVRTEAVVPPLTPEVRTVVVPTQVGTEARLVAPTVPISLENTMPVGVDPLAAQIDTAVHELTSAPQGATLTEMSIAEGLEIATEQGRTDAEAGEAVERAASY